jgi:hypothetical protein
VLLASKEFQVPQFSLPAPSSLRMRAPKCCADAMGHRRLDRNLKEQLGID